MTSWPLRWFKRMGNNTNMATRSASSSSSSSSSASCQRQHVSQNANVQVHPHPRTRSKSSLKTSHHLKFKYSRHEQELMKRFLPDFVSATPSTQFDMLVVRDHWEKLHMYYPTLRSDQQAVMAPVDELTDGFYGNLFALAPHLEALMLNSAHQQIDIIRFIVQTIEHLLKSDDMMARAFQITQAHIHHGVKIEHFNVFGKALFKTLQQVAPQLWTEQVDTSWRAVFCQIALVLVDLQDSMLHDREVLSCSRQHQAYAASCRVGAVTSSCPFPALSNDLLKVMSCTSMDRRSHGVTWVTMNGPRHEEPHELNDESSDESSDPKLFSNPSTDHSDTHLFAFQPRDPPASGTSSPSKAPFDHGSTAYHVLRSWFRAS